MDWRYQRDPLTAPALRGFVVSGTCGPFDSSSSWRPPQRSVVGLGGGPQARPILNRTSCLQFQRDSDTVGLASASLYPTSQNAIHEIRIEAVCVCPRRHGDPLVHEPCSYLFESEYLISAFVLHSRRPRICGGMAGLHYAHTFFSRFLLRQYRAFKIIAIQ